MSHRRIQIVAHRGASAEQPENTLRAYRRAIELGVDAVETDIRLSADGVPMLFHDPDLARIAGRDAALADLTCAELQSLDAGQGEPIPTFAELVAECHGRTGLVIDLKVAGACATLARILDDAGFDRSLISVCAWTDAQAEDARTFLPDVVLRYIEHDTDPHHDDAWFEALRAKGFSALSLKWTDLSTASIAAARDHGFHVATWTVNDAESMSAAASAGVDAIITADPALAARTLATGCRA